MKAEFLGHPRGLAVLFASEMWERFSYYGMRALLVLYMVKYLLAPERAAGTLGLDGLRQGLELIFGPLTDQAFASQIYGIYTSCVYLSAILGGLLADRGLGRKRTIALGAALMVAGHSLMAFEPLFLVALALIIFGNGAFKPNISTQVGELYAPQDPRRDRAYSIFYVGINVGAFFAPLVCGTIGETIGWHYGFACAGVGMAIGLATYLLGRSLLPMHPRGERQRPAEPVSGDDQRRAMTGILLLFPSSALFWAAFEQQGNTIALWVDRFTDRSVHMFGWSADIPVTWFQAFNPAMIFLFTPPLVSWWSRRAREGAETSTISKLSLGCWGVALSYLVLAVAAATNDGGKSNWLWLLAYFIVITISELHFSPITLSLVSRLAPSGARSALMGFWFTSIFLGNLVGGWVGGLWSALPTVQFFLLIAALGAIAGATIEAARRSLDGILK